MTGLQHVNSKKCILIAMTQDALLNISRILERDSKSTTYKFALLRGVIDIILENSPYIQIRRGRAHMPLGLLIEKWLVYYYPIVESNIRIPQINGSAKLAFEDVLAVVVFGYKQRGDFSACYNDLTRKSIPDDMRASFVNLVQKLRSTITQMPMKYIGTSINNSHYSIFDFEGSVRMRTDRPLDLQYLIKNCGTFSIPLDYYEAFRILGRFVNGKDSILMKWAEFSVRASADRLPIERVLHNVLKSPITDRDVSESKKLYAEVLKSSGKVICVWTGQTLRNFDIDHVIPFSVWRNNDLWNLLPSSPTVNNQKRDRIPVPGFIESRRNFIVQYWELLNDKQPQRFQREIQLALLGEDSGGDWQSRAIRKLKESCEYLVGVRGYEGWEN